MTTPLRHARAALKLDRSKIALVLAAARVIYAAMLAEALRFTTPVPTLVVLLAQITALDLAQQAVHPGVRGPATAARNAARDALFRSLRSLLAYVQTVADADLENSFAIIKSAGFNVALVGAHPKPALAATVTGLTGGVKLVANASLLAGGAKKRAVYNWAYSLDGGHTWVPLPGTPKARTTVSGLAPLTNVGFRVSATVGEVIGPWSQTVTIPVH